MFSLRPYRESTDCFLVGSLKSIAIKPTANTKEEFLTTKGEIMEYTFTSKTIRTKVGSGIRSILVFVEVYVDWGFTIVLGNTDISQIKPI